MNENKLNITPDTKLGTLLETYPHLEEVLVEMTPEFNKLRNPVLRETIYKIISLQQVAQTGNVSLSELINKLRSEAGIKGEKIDDEIATDSSDKPGWFDESKIMKKLDARELLERGEHPMAQVLEEVKEFEKGQIYELITPFLPAPLVDKVKSQGFEAWSYEDQDNITKSFFIKK